jgi:hypothetical protein
MADHKATPEQWKEIEEFPFDDANTFILDLRARVEQLEAQANPTKMVPLPVATEGNKTPMMRLCAFTGDPPAPHETWGDWFRDVLKTRTLEGVRVRAIAPGDFSFATPPPVATDEELRAMWDRAYDLRQAFRAIYDLGVEHGKASSREVADPAPVTGDMEELVADLQTMPSHDTLQFDANTVAALMAEFVKINGSREVAEPAPVAGGLVARVAAVISPKYGLGWAPEPPEARAAILEVAKWLRFEMDWKEAADLFEQEARR